MEFSILIAHYNNHIYFKDCYTSLLKQSFTDFEIVILDDHSATESYEAIKTLTYHDPRVRLFQNSENKGVGYTKNKLVQLAKGNICAFVDPDDALVDNALETIVLEFEKNPESTAIYSQLYWCDDHLNILNTFRGTRKVENKNTFFFNLRSEVAHLFAFKVECYMRTEGINPKLSSAEDIDLYLKLYEVGEFRFIKKPLYLYRVHSKGVSQNKEKKKKLKDTLSSVIKDATKRRNIQQLYGKDISEINNLPEYIYQKQNTILQRIKRRLPW